MSEYLITKRTTCEKCYGKGYYLVGYEDMGTECPACNCVGYTDEMVDADDWIRDKLNDREASSTLDEWRR